MSGIIIADDEILVSIIDLYDSITVLTLVSLLITLILIVRRIKGSLFIGMIITGIIGFLTKNLTFSGIISTPPAPVFFDIDISGVFSQGLYTVVFAFLLVTIFDTTGTMIDRKSVV